MRRNLCCDACGHGIKEGQKIVMGVAARLIEANKRITKCANSMNYVKNYILKTMKDAKRAMKSTAIIMRISWMDITSQWNTKASNRE